MCCKLFTVSWLFTSYDVRLNKLSFWLFAYKFEDFFLQQHENIWPIISPECLIQFTLFNVFAIKGLWMFQLSMPKGTFLGWKSRFTLRQQKIEWTTRKTYRCMWSQNQWIIDWRPNSCFKRQEYMCLFHPGQPMGLLLTITLANFGRECSAAPSADLNTRQCTFGFRLYTDSQQASPGSSHVHRRLQCPQPKFVFNYILLWNDIHKISEPCSVYLLQQCPIWELPGLTLAWSMPGLHRCSAKWRCPGAMTQLVNVASRILLRRKRIVFWNASPRMLKTISWWNSTRRNQNTNNFSSTRWTRRSTMFLSLPPFRTCRLMLKFFSWNDLKFRLHPSNAFYPNTSSRKKWSRKCTMFDDTESWAPSWLHPISYWAGVEKFVSFVCFQCSLNYKQNNQPFHFFFVPDKPNVWVKNIKTIPDIYHEDYKLLSVDGSSKFSLGLSLAKVW